MEFDFECEKDKIIEIDGFIEKGKQYDLDIELEEDKRDVIYGVVKDSCNEPVKNAVVKLIEVSRTGRRYPISHTFTNDDGEFVFGPICSDKKYAINIWANQVEHTKIYKHCHKEEHCLKKIDIECDTDENVDK